MHDDVRTIRVLSLGAGVQSTTMLLRCLDGELPKPDAVIFADTGWEPADVYRHLWWLGTRCVEASVPIYIARAGDIRSDALISQVRGHRADGHRWASLPFAVKNPDGSVGRIRRQCTTEYKLQPINQAIRRWVVGLKPRQRMPKDVLVERWIGISTDEAHRMKPARESWSINVYPLCDMPARGYRQMSRAACIEWLKEHYPEITPTKSACIGCPYTDNHRWREMKMRAWQHADPSWLDAVTFDATIRNSGGKRGQIFIHRSVAPLDEIDLTDVTDYGQTDLFGEECEGMCGL